MTLLVILIALCAMPLLAEATRMSVAKKRQQGVPGELVDLPKGTTHIQRDGPEDGPVVVLVHGLTTPAYLFAGVVPMLGAAGYRVIRYDLWGRGFSDCPIGRQDGDYFLDQLNAVLDHEEVAGPFVLVGYSMGGAIAALTAAADPGEIAALALVAPTGLGPANVPKLTRWPILGDWVMWVLGGVLLRRRLKGDGFKASVVTDLPKLEARETRTRGYLPGVLSSMRQLVTRDMAPEHTRIAAAGAPVLAIWGEADRSVPLSSMARLAEVNGQAWHHQVDGADHGLIHNRPGEVGAEILRFLKARSGR